MTFFDYSPSQVTINITWQAGTFTTTGHPVYRSVSPNGPDCEPVCKVGMFNVLIP